MRDKVISKLVLSFFYNFFKFVLNPFIFIPKSFFIRGGSEVGIKKNPFDNHPYLLMK